MKSTHTEGYQRAIAALVAARKERQILQGDLAERLGKPQSYISKLELRERRLGPVDKVLDPQPDRSDENEPAIAGGSFVVSGGQSAALLEL